MLAQPNRRENRQLGQPKRPARPISWQLAALGWLIDRLGPIIEAKVHKRAKRGQEIQSRIAERFGTPSSPRPNGPLLWVHGASLGESNSLLPLVDGFLAQHPTHHVLFTSGSASSAKRLTAALPARARHQFLPAENSAWFTRFLTHWRPDALVIAEQEFWPQMLIQTHRQAIPMMIVNGRLSVRSARRWQRLKALGLNLPGLVDTAHVQDAAQRQTFIALGIEPLPPGGNLKFLRPSGRVQFHPGLKGKKDTWTITLAMTHPGEEPAMLQSLAPALAEDASLRLLWVPRHIERIEAVEALAKQCGLEGAGLWSSGARPQTRQVVLVDRYGEMPSVYEHSDVVVLGGSFDPSVGGHSPLEALHCATPVILGPHMQAQASIMDVLCAPSRREEAKAQSRSAVAQAATPAKAIALAIAYRQPHMHDAQQGQLAAFEACCDNADAAFDAIKAWVAEATA